MATNCPPLRRCTSTYGTLQVTVDILPLMIRSRASTVVLGDLFLSKFGKSPCVRVIVQIRTGACTPTKPVLLNNELYDVPPPRVF